jgi:sarcosine oxidase
MWDTVVLGLGGVGSFALRAVAREDTKASVLGIERFCRGHDKGSSHGKNRVYRRAYFEHPSYVPWIEFSIKECTALQSQQNIPIIQECGVLLAVPKDSANLIEAALASAKEHNIVTEELGVDALRQRFLQFSYTDDMIGVYEPGGGFMRPEAATTAALKDAEEYGATIWENTVVGSIREIQDETGCKVSHIEIVVQREKGEETILARNVLVAAGAWTSELMPTFAPHLKVLRQLQTWVDTSPTTNSSIYDSSRMPALGMLTADVPNPIYALPADSEAKATDKYKGCVKLGIHARECPVDPNLNPSKVTQAEQEEMANAIKAGFRPEVSSQPLMETKPCMYTMTSDEHFMIGVPKGYERVCVVAGLSGHGFKMVPALGQMLADFALGKGLDQWNASFCSPSRFGV